MNKGGTGVGMPQRIIGRAQPPGVPVRKGLHHLTPAWVKPGACFFITICGKQRKENQLCFQEVSKVVFEAARHYHDDNGWYLKLMLLMPDHRHAILAPAPDKNLAKVIGNRKRYIASKTKVTWQKDFFDHRLRSVESSDEKTVYILANPVRTGLLNHSEIWPFILQP